MTASTTATTSAKSYPNVTRIAAVVKLSTGAPDAGVSTPLPAARWRRRFILLCSRHSAAAGRSLKSLADELLVAVSRVFPRLLAFSVKEYVAPGETGVHPQWLFTFPGVFYFKTGSPPLVQ